MAPAGMDAAFTEMLFSSAAAGVALLDTSLRYVRVNDALAAINGVPADQHAGRFVRDVLPAAAADALEPLLRRVLAGEAVIDLPIDAEVEGLGRRHVVASYRPVRGADGEVTGIVAFIAERTPAEKLLRETENRLQRVSESGIVGFFDWHIDGRVLDANDALLNLLGYTRDDLTAGRIDWRGMTPPELEERDRPAVRALLEDGYHGPLAKAYFSKDGRRVPVLITSAFVDGSRERGVCVCLDDSARRAAEMRLERVLMQTPAAVGVLLGPNHVVQSVNEMFHRLLGRRDYVGRPAAEAAPELVAQGFLARMDEVYRTGTAFHGKDAPLVWDRDGDGTMYEGFFDFVYQPLFDAAGAVEGILVFAVEVTEQVRSRQEVERLLAESECARASADAANAQIREMEGLSRQLFALSPLPTWVYDRETLAFVEVNEAAVRHYGYSREEFLGMTLRDIQPDGEVSLVPQSLVAPSRTAARGVVRHRGSSGEVMDVELFSQDFERAGRPAGIVVVQDITERRRSEVALLEATHTAESANRAKSEFLAVMSHELRTPLNAIGGYTELLEMGIHGPVTQAQLQALGRIQLSQRHLLGLINEVLNYTRLETGAVHFALEEVPVREQLLAAEALVAPQARAKGLSLTVETCAAGLVARADAEKLRQILINLLGNAVKFTPEGGAITISAAPYDGVVRVRVRDDGIGIPADKLEAIFDPFVQVRADLTRPHEGTGLGLAISRDLARGMGGNLAAESTPGVGSVFTLTLVAA